MKSKKNILAIPVPLYHVTVLVAWDVPIESVGRHCRKHGYGLFINGRLITDATLPEISLPQPEDATP